jgi:hypothetical protein
MLYLNGIIKCKIWWLNRNAGCSKLVLQAVKNNYIVILEKPVKNHEGIVIFVTKKKKDLIFFPYKKQVEMIV